MSPFSQTNHFLCFSSIFNLPFYSAKKSLFDFTFLKSQDSLLRMNVLVKHLTNNTYDFADSLRETVNHKNVQLPLVHCSCTYTQQKCLPKYFLPLFCIIWRCITLLVTIYLVQGIQLTQQSPLSQINCFLYFNCLSCPASLISFFLLVVVLKLIRIQKNGDVSKPISGKFTWKRFW